MPNRNIISLFGGFNMAYLQNLHTHTTYCDGKDTPVEMIESAIAQGFDSIGFSGHGFTFYSPAPPMSLEGTVEYKKEITGLKDVYEGKLDIFLGLEFDMYSGVDLAGYDYLLGACHYLKIDDRYVGFDRSADVVQGVIDTEFSGNGMAFAKEYYRQLSTLADYGSFDILAHFDLVTKNIEKIPYFDINSKEYLDAAFESISALKGKIPFFEVNTGAISRGYRTTPYTTLPILREFKKQGFGAMISSDCHDSKHLKTGFDMARNMLIEAGFDEQYILTKNGFCAVEL